VVFESFCQKDTEDFAEGLARRASPGDFYALIGPLAAGKTAFARGFARGLGILEDITSPTFAIINEYSGPGLPLYHFDVYRIGQGSDMENTGFEEYFYGAGVVLVEWADMIEDMLPPGAVVIKFELDAQRGGNFRRISIGGDCGLEPV